PRGARVDAEVEDDEIDTRRKIVAPQDIPIARAVDFARFIALELPKVVGRKVWFLPPILQDTERDSELSSRVRILGIVGEAPFLGQDDVDTSSEIRRLRLGSRPGRDRRLDGGLQDFGLLGVRLYGVFQRFGLLGLVLERRGGLA